MRRLEVSMLSLPGLVAIAAIAFGAYRYIQTLHFAEAAAVRRLPLGDVGSMPNHRSRALVASLP